MIFVLLKILGTISVPAMVIVPCLLLEAWENYRNKRDK